MIKVSIFQDESKHVIGFRCNGHSGYAKSGQDIICSAVSALVLNLINSIELLTEDRFDFSEDEKDGRIDFMIKGKPCHDADLLLRSMLLGLQNIEEEYGKKYISVSHLLDKQLFYKEV